MTQALDNKHVGGMEQRNKTFSVYVQDQVNFVDCATSLSFSLKKSRLLSYVFVGSILSLQRKIPMVISQEFTVC